MTMQYQIKRASQRWKDAILKEREPDMLHEVIGSVPEITTYGGLETMTWEWELMERRYSSGMTLDSLKSKWFDYHDDYQFAYNTCPSLHFRDDHGNIRMKVGVKAKWIETPSGHHRSIQSDDAGRKHELSFQLIEFKGKTLQQVVCSCCGVIDEAAAFPILKTQVELKRYRNKQETRFSVTYTDCWGAERRGSFKSFYQAYAYAIGKPAHIVQQREPIQRTKT